MSSTQILLSLLELEQDNLAASCEDYGMEGYKRICIYCILQTDLLPLLLLVLLQQYS
jgi:hypothetical protein